ncbi:TonB-dependent siderophore receptor [Oleiharenicola sp. Vm1]|uniref:TonB-dependent siderophore receptor n=1 Tax=Oleiharenicola sp. Vm1 TaxID=3398393 RepID=UPI0039F46AD6
MKFTPRLPLLLLALVANAEAQSSSSAAPLSSAATNDRPVELSPFMVRTDRDHGYSATDSLGASRVALPVGEVPLSVISLTEQMFADRAALDAMDVLGFVSGVQQQADGGPGQAGYSLRGFANTGLRVRDGLPERVEGVDYPFDDAAGYERLEVIKGPAGTLYGTTSMGGVVNKISKWPKFRPETKIELQAQSYDEFVRGMLDSTGPLSDNTAYRLVLSERRGHRYYDEKDAPNNFSNYLFVLSHRIGPAHTGRIWARANYFRFELDRENGAQFPTGYLDPKKPTVAAVLTNPRFAVPLESNQVPEDDVSIANIYSYEGGYEQTFAGPLGGEWTIRLVGRFSKGKGDKSPSYAVTRPVPVDASGKIVPYTNAAGVLVNGDARFIAADDPRVADWRTTMTAREFAGYNQDSGAYLDLVGAFSTGPLKHKAVFNAQLESGETERAFFFWNVPFANNTTAVANSFSVLHPDFSRFSFATIKATVPTQFNPFNGHSESDGFAAGFQDNVNLFGDRLIGVVGARYDSVENTAYSFDSAQSLAQKKFVKNAASTSIVKNQEWSFRYGLVGKPFEGVSVFAQHGETYIPVNTLDSSGVKYPNREGEIRELGVKVDLWGTRLVATASVFKMQLTNVLVSVPNPPELGGGLRQEPAGTQKTDGFEVDLTAEPVRGLNLTLAYSDLTSKNEAGQYFRGVPVVPTWSVLGKYSWRQGRCAAASRARAGGASANRPAIPPTRSSWTVRTWPMPSSATGAAPGACN